MTTEGDGGYAYIDFDSTIVSSGKLYARVANTISTNGFIHTELRGPSDTEGLCERLDRIEEILGMGQRNLDLEAKYPELEMAGKVYHQKIDKIFETIKAKNFAAYKEYLDLQEEYRIIEKLKENNGRLNPTDG